MKDDYTVLIKSNENEIRKISSKISEKQRKAAKNCEISFVIEFSHQRERNFAAPLSCQPSKFRRRRETSFEMSSEISLQSDFSQEISMSSPKCRAKFRHAATFRTSFRSALRNFEMHFRDPLQSFQHE